MRARGAELLTVAGRQELGTFWERVVQPQFFALLVARYGGTERVSSARSRRRDCQRPVHLHYPARRLRRDRAATRRCATRWPRIWRWRSGSCGRAAAGARGGARSALHADVHLAGSRSYAGGEERVRGRAGRDARRSADAGALSGGRSLAGATVLLAPAVVARRRAGRPHVAPRVPLGRGRASWTHARVLDAGIYAFLKLPRLVRGGVSARAGWWCSTSWSRRWRADGGWSGREEPTPCSRSTD